MTDKVKQMAPIIWAEIEKAQHILMHAHPSPDGDSYGSILGMKFILEKVGKQVTIISGDSPKPIFLSKLPGSDGILENNYFEIDPSKFDLFLIFDSSSKNQISKKGDIVFPKNMKTVVVDHHPSNTGFGDIDLIETSYPATSQIIYDLVSKWNLKITPDAAVCLFIGIFTDTGGFKYKMTTSNTLKAAARLSEINPNFSEVIFQIDNSNTREVVDLMGIMLSSVETYFNNRVAIAIARKEGLDKKKINLKNVFRGDIANLLKSVIGWDIGITLIEVGDSQVEVNFRTRDSEKFDLSKIGSKLGGGGLKAAAGAPILKSYSEAKKMLLNTLKEVYPELGQP